MKIRWYDKCDGTPPTLQYQEHENVYDHWSTVPTIKEPRKPAAREWEVFIDKKGDIGCGDWQDSLAFFGKYRRIRVRVREITETEEK